MEEKVLFNSIMPRLEEKNPAVSEFIEACGGNALRDKLRVIYEMLEDAGARVNLTALHGESSVLLHLFDSLMLAREVSRLAEKATVCDVGCGGGFPSLPLAAALPDVRVTSVDSTAKKLSFVADCAAEIKVLLNTLPARAEELPASGYRGRFDFATARAVAKLNVLTELCMPLVRVGGFFLPMKTDDRELSDAKKAISLLGGEIADAVTYSLFSETERFSRVIFVIRKVREAPDFPRKFAKIVKSPL